MPIKPVGRTSRATLTILSSVLVFVALLTPIAGGMAQTVDGLQSSGYVGVPCVPITLTFGAVPNETFLDVVIEVNGSNYAGYLSPDWSNLEFFTTSGPVQAWIEDNPLEQTSPIPVWVKLPSVLPGSSMTLFMAFMPRTDSVLSADGPTGEAPQLSATYGEYDNGRLVFPFYDNFDEPSLNLSTWTVSGQGSGGLVSTGEGLITTTDSSSIVNVQSVREFDFPQVFEWYTGPFVSNTSSVYQFELGGSAGGFNLQLGHSGGLALQVQIPTGLFSTEVLPVQDNRADNLFAVSTNGQVATASLDYLTVAQLNVNYTPIDVHFSAVLNLESGMSTPPVYYVRARVPFLNGTQPTVEFGPLETQFLIRFISSGLPPSALWSVVLGNVTGTVNSNTAVFLRPNGSYPFRVLPLPGFIPSTNSSGDVSVNGGNQTVTVIWVVRTYEASFIESGLSNNTEWSVTIYGEVIATHGHEILLNLPDGEYNFTIGSAPGFSPSIVSGSIRIEGSNITQPVYFEPAFSGGLPIDDLSISFVILLVAAGVVILRGSARVGRKPKSQAPVR